MFNKFSQEITDEGACPYFRVSICKSNNDVTDIGQNQKCSFNLDVVSDIVIHALINCNLGPCREILVQTLMSYRPNAMKAIIGVSSVRLGKLLVP